MKHLFKIYILLAVISGYTYGQPGKGRITGSVKDAEGRSLNDATIVLTGNFDSSIIKKTIADGQGKFRFYNLPNGNFSITITHIGYKSSSVIHVVIDTLKNIIQLPPVVLISSSAQLLKQVTVALKRPLIEQKIDRTIVNVDAMLSVAGSDALDALSKSPGVIVDQNGDISLNGKKNVLVLIDDHPTYMSGQDLALYLRSLPAGTLDKIELISNPPARYDASGNAIIDIVLKKNLSAGFNGVVNLGYNQGVYARSNDALNVNYRTKKYNLFSNISYSHDQNFNKESYDRYYYKTDGLLNSSIYQNSYYKYNSNGFNGRLGLDYFISPSTTLSGVGIFNTRTRGDNTSYTANQFNSNMQPDSTINGVKQGDYTWRNTAVNLNFQHKINKAGRALSGSFDYLQYNPDNNQAATSVVLRPDGALQSSQQMLFVFPSVIKIYSGKIDYVMPLKNKAEFNAGIKYSHSITDAVYEWYNGDNRLTGIDYRKSNHFLYTENIASGYLSYKTEWRRWGLQAGLRMENTQSDGHQFGNPVTTDTLFERQYTNLFPSAHLSYKLDSAGKHVLALNFSRGIRRPGYQQINPFVFFIDQYTYTSGNPNLTAAFSQYAELRYSYRQYFGLTFSYGGGSNSINTTTVAQGNSFISKPYNFINNKTFVIVSYISVNPFSWWTLNVNAILLYQINKGNANGIVIDQVNHMQELEATNHIQFSKNWSAELNGFFPGSQTFAQTKSSSVFNISAGIQKQTLHGNGTIRLNVNDIFHTLPISSQTTGITNIAAFNHREADRRWVGISFIYRFGKSANERKRNDNSSAEEEKARIN